MPFSKKWQFRKSSAEKCGFYDVKDQRYSSFSLCRNAGKRIARGTSPHSEKALIDSIFMVAFQIIQRVTKSVSTSSVSYLLQQIQT